MKLRTKLLTAFLAVGIIPFTIVSILSLVKSSDALSRQAYDQLEGMRGVKKAQIEGFFSQRRGDMGVLLETVAALKEEAFNKLKSVETNKRMAVELLSQQWFIDIEAQQSRSICTKGMTEFRNFLNSGEKSPEYIRYANIIDQYIKTTGYYDFLLSVWMVTSSIPRPKNQTTTPISLPGPTRIQVWAGLSEKRWLKRLPLLKILHPMHPVTANPPPFLPHLSYPQEK